MPPDKKKAEKPFMRRWSIEAQLAPTYAYRSINQAGSSQNISEYSNETGLFAYSAMVKVNYQVSNNLHIQAGIGFSTLGYTSYNVYYTESMMSFLHSDGELPSSTGQKYYVINSSAYCSRQSSSGMTNLTAGTTGAEYPSSVNSPLTKANADFIQQMNYVEIPFLIRYRVLGNKVSIHLLGGLGTQLLVSSSGRINDGNMQTNISESSLYNKLNISSTLGIGLNYRLPNQAVFVIEPTYKYFVNSITTAGNNVHPYTFGVFTGLTYNF
jgi:hypothetical protein